MEDLDFQSILEQIEAEVSLQSSQIKSEDSNLITASSRENDKFSEPYYIRDSSYAELLGEYIQVYRSKARWNKWFKLSFFVLAMLAFVGIITLSLVSLIIIVINAAKTDVVSNVALALSSMAGIISAIIVLPKIIAEHLFPTNEDENMIGMVKNMQVNDSKIRALMKKKPQK